MSAPPPTSSLPPKAPTWRENGSWGWLVVVSGVALGTATTAYGLTLRCGDSDEDCKRNTSLAIWGGVGIMAVGTALGVMIVQIGQARVQARPAMFAGMPGFTLDARF